MSLDALIGKPHIREPFFKEGKTVTPKKWMKPVSDKRKIELPKYFDAKKEWKSEREAIDGFRCQVVDDKGHRCKRKASDHPHHIRKRGIFLSDKQWFLATCIQCHDFIENNKKWAVKNGYLIRDYKA